MDMTLESLIEKIKNHEDNYLSELISKFNPFIFSLIKGEVRESKKNYYDSLVTELIIMIYALNTEKITNKQAYLQKCLRNYFIKLNSTSFKSDLNFEEQINLYSLDDYEIYENDIQEYLRILKKYLNKKQLDIFIMKEVSRKSVIEIAEKYNRSEDSIYKALKKAKFILSNNDCLKKDIIENLL